MRISHSSVSEAGPRPVNEDYLECWVADGGDTIACIADGLGGMGGGDVASKLAVSEFRNFIQRHGASEVNFLKAAREAHRRIQKAQSSSEQRQRMATTLTAVCLSNARLFGVHCGDSRAVIARRRGIKRLTKDHSEGQRLFEAGKLSKEELATYKRKHILESALGDLDEPTIDAFSFDLLPNDRVILTTDGVHSLVLLREMQHLSAASATPSELVKRVASAVEQYGPADNYSIVALYAG